jgi:hypothetical protein
MNFNPPPVINLTQGWGNQTICKQAMNITTARKEKNKNGFDHQELRNLLRIRSVSNGHAWAWGESVRLGKISERPVSCFDEAKAQEH